MKAFDKVNMIYGAIATIGVAILGKYWFLFAGFLILNVIDYATGFVKAKYYEKNESSAIGAKGVWKKVSYWIVIGLAFFMSHCFVEMGKIIGIDLSFMMMLGWFTLATYMVNEVRSILENLVRMHVNVPQFLIAGLDVAQKLIDSKTNIKEETKSEEIIYQSTDERQNGRADSSGT